MRLKSGLTQEQLSAKMQLLNCDITRSALAKIEVGQRHLYVNELKVIKEILNITYDDILLIKDKEYRKIIILDYLAP